MSNTSDVRHILVISDSKSRRMVSLTESLYTIGRDPNTNILLYDRQVSRHHATILHIHIEEDKTDFPSYRIIDGNLQGKKSTNGLIINGKYCLSHDLKSGDQIRFGPRCSANYYLLPKTTELSVLKGGDDQDEREIDPKQTEEFSLDKSTGKLDQILNQSPLETIDSSLVETIVPENYWDNKSHLIDIAQGNPNPIIEIDFQGKITYLNIPAKVKFLDIDKSPATHPLFQGIIGQSAPPQKTSLVREVQVDQGFWEQHIHYLEDNQSIRIYLFEITKYKKREEKLSASKDRYRLFVEQGLEGILLINKETQYIIEANQAYCQLLGYTSAEIIGLSFYQLVALDKQIINQQLQNVTPETPYIFKESVHRHKDGSLISVAGKITQTVYQGQEIFCCVVTDITARKQAEEKLEYQALHDPLTNLPNRESFNKELSLALDHAQRYQHLMAVMFVDIDSFTHINNTLGHSIGDQLLQSFAKRLSSSVRKDDSVARWGNDEFVLLLPQIKNTEDTVKLAQRIFETLHGPFTIENNQLQIKCSIGIAIYPQDGENAETLLKNADAALHRTKQQGRNHYQFYSADLTAEAGLLLKLEGRLHQGIEKKQFSLYYQPQIEIKTGQVVAMEALLRWEHPELGIIPPQKFIPLAQKTDLILHLSKWVLQTACEQNLTWQKDGLPPIPIAVNLCEREFQQPNLAEVVARALDKTGLDPQWLELEITEMTLRQHLIHARKTLQDLHNLGVRVALDDFGMGFSSLGYLKQFSFRTLKLHQAFIRDLRGTSEELGIISAALAIGKGFNIRVVAEGVETQQQLDILNNLDCKEVQGYWFSRPMPTKEATEFLRNNQGCNETVNSKKI